ncbi:MAG: NAD(P)-binding domain-containing protein, partial [Burkholderiaceae bacterium]|nr:NAD(P)-binding domain-containing protein [Burkholderiaceae bacterium]
MRIAFIGGGNMAAALIAGLRAAGSAAADLLAVEIDAARRAQLERDYGIATAERPSEALRGYDLLVLAVKPQQMQEACAQLAPFAAGRSVLSVAAGIRARDLARWLATRTVVRAMPNTPALIGRGVSGLAALPEAAAAQRLLAERVLRAVGDVVWFDDEALLDAVTAVSGSG